MVARDEFPGLTAAWATVNAVFEGAERSDIIDDFAVLPRQRVGVRARKLVGALDLALDATKNSPTRESRSDPTGDPGLYMVTVSGQKGEDVRATALELAQGRTLDSFSHRRTNGFGRQTRATFAQDGNEIIINSFKVPLFGSGGFKRAG